MRATSLPSIGHSSAMPNAAMPSAAMGSGEVGGMGEWRGHKWRLLQCFCSSSKPLIWREDDLIEVGGPERPNPDPDPGRSPPTSDRER